MTTSNTHTESDTNMAQTADAKGPSTIKTLRDFFGKKEGQTLSDMANEFKELSTEEKQQLADGINNGSLNY